MSEVRSTCDTWVTTHTTAARVPWERAYTCGRRRGTLRHFSARHLRGDEAHMRTTARFIAGRSVRYWQPQEADEDKLGG